MAFSPCSAHGGLPLGRYMLTSKWRVLQSCLMEEAMQKAAQLQRVAVLWAGVRHLPWPWPYLENNNPAKMGELPGHRQKKFAP
jgi:hypothetical protein